MQQQEELDDLPAGKEAGRESSLAASAGKLLQPDTAAAEEEKEDKYQLYNDRWVQVLCWSPAASDAPVTLLVVLMRVMMHLMRLMQQLVVCLMHLMTQLMMQQLVHLMCDAAADDAADADVCGARAVGPPLAARAPLGLGMLRCCR